MQEKHSVYTNSRLMKNGHLYKWMRRPTELIEAPPSCKPKTKEAVTLYNLFHSSDCCV